MSSSHDPEVAGIIERLRLQPHPEGGFYREVWRASEDVPHPSVMALRAASTSIYYLLPGDTFSAWHVVESDETWHLYGGGPLELHTLEDGVHRITVLSSDLNLGEPQATVKAGTLQACRPAAGAAYALCGCTVAPGFDFADFRMPPRDELLAAHPNHAEAIRTLTRN